MYTTHYNKDGSLKHSPECRMAFGKKDPECPRCVELINGAEPRDGWQKGYYGTKKRQDEANLEAIKAHFSSHKHLSGGCGVVCTFGEW